VEQTGSKSRTFLIDDDEGTAEWSGERANATEDTPNVGQKEIVAHDITAKMNATADMLEDAYFDLAAWLQGKGAERHGGGKPFDRQPMMEISRMLGGPSGCFYQAMKKTQEASRMEPEAAKREILGAINYLAGAYLLLDEQGDV
jgi:hypothetical protein